ncbi:allatostatin-A receptor-like [Paramuricea clavata]|uniref:Allatostatin-A receptor-like n=1 Tax=Paramuricea clavata TaxID=317549 RepID=A0A7D9K918_PARCT|nr:allatostatin-A receptor-like [Paramuricea clavata]
MLFLFGVVSVYTVTFLSTERWLAVQYPFKYRIAISSTKVKVCVLFIWVLSLLANAPNLTEMSPTNDFRTPCQWKYKNYQTREMVATLEILLKFILPSLILVLVLLSLYRKFYHQNLDSSIRPHREKQLLRMCAATSFVVLICWSPNQVYYLLHKLDVVKIGTNWHHMTVALALSTSAINPIIYYVTNSDSSLSPVSYLETEFPAFPTGPMMAEEAQALQPGLLDLLQEMTDRLQAHQNQIAGAPPRASGLQSPVFHGSPTEDYDEWLQKFQRYATFNGWTPDQQLNWFVMFLSGSALRVYQRQTDEIRADLDALYKTL